MSTENVPGAPILLTMAEASKVTRLSQSHLRALVKAQRIPVVKFCDRPGSRIFFSLDDLKKFIESCKSTANGT